MQHIMRHELSELEVVDFPTAMSASVLLHWRFNGLQHSTTLIKDT